MSLTVLAQFNEAVQCTLVSTANNQVLASSSKFELKAPTFALAQPIPVVVKFEQVTMELSGAVTDSDKVVGAIGGVEVTLTLDQVDPLAASSLKTTTDKNGLYHFSFLAIPDTTLTAKLVIGSSPEFQVPDSISLTFTTKAKTLT